MIFVSFQGAFFGIILGHLCGIARLIVELMYPAPPCGEADDRPAFLTKLHYSYYVQLQLLFTAIMIVLISLLTKSRSDEQVMGKNDDNKSAEAILTVTSQNDYIFSATRVVKKFCELNFLYFFLFVLASYFLF